MSFLSLVALVSASKAASPAWKGLHVDPWGNNALRIRFSLKNSPPYNGPGALSDTPPSMNGVETYISSSRWSSGDLSLSLAQDTLTLARGNVKLADITLAFSVKSVGSQKNVTTLTVATASASAKPTSYFGFGEHENGKLDQVPLGLKSWREKSIKFASKHAKSIKFEVEIHNSISSSCPFV